MTTTSIKIKDLRTEQQVQFIKQTFPDGLKNSLQLHQVFAPLYVTADSGINDNLNGTERPVTFTPKHTDTTYSIVHSLAKWKRLRIRELNIPLHEGIITNMVALRPDEDLSPIHSILVDQWDWEMHIAPQDRTIQFLETTVAKIYSQLYHLEQHISTHHLHTVPILPKTITFIHAEELYHRYPDKTPKEREHLITREYGAVFIIGIGGALPDGYPHDRRAPDYDDWSTPTSGTYKGLNGDMLVWHPTLNRSFEISSMGIRVNKQALTAQLDITAQTHRSELQFHKLLLSGQLPHTIGGGIGQSAFVCSCYARHI